MTDYSDVKAFKEHALWASVRNCIEAWKKSKPLTPTDRHTISRVLTTLHYLAEYRPIDPVLFPSTRMTTADTLKRYVDEMYELWRTWTEEAPMTTASVSELDRYCDLLMTTVVTEAWPTLQKESRARIYAEAADAFKATAEASLVALSESVDESDERLTEVEAKVESATKTLVEFEIRATSTLDDMEAELENELKATKQKLSELIAASNDRLKAVIKDHDSDVQELFRSTDDQAEALLGLLKGYAESGEKLLQIVGDQAQAEGYQNFADAERRGYRWWVFAGSAAIAATAIYLGVEFAALARGDDPSTAVIVFKAALSVTGLSFSALAFREAGKKQRQSLEARYRALDLLALRPYTVGMEEDDAKALRTMLGERLFKNTPEDVGRKTDEKITTLRLDLGDFKTAVDTAKTVKDIASGPA